MDIEKRKDLALAFLRGLQNRDYQVLRSVLTDDAVWSLPGTSHVGGEARGADAVVARGEYLGKHGVNFELLHVIFGQQGMGIILHNTGRREGAVLDEYLASIFTLRDDKIARVDTLISDVPMLDAYAV
jgi:ketosteroid isomerase-like protein